MWSENSDNLTYFLLFCPFLVFILVVALSETLSTILNNSKESGIFVLLLSVKEILFSCQHVLTGGLSYVTYIMLTSVPSVPRLVPGLYERRQSDMAG